MTTQPTRSQQLERIAEAARIVNESWNNTGDVGAVMFAELHNSLAALATPAEQESGEAVRSAAEKLLQVIHNSGMSHEEQCLCDWCTAIDEMKRSLTTPSCNERAGGDAGT